MAARKGVTRRHFLVATAAAAAGCATGVKPGTVPPEVRVGVIGCGAHGSALIHMLASDPACAKAQVTAVSDVYEPRLAQARETVGARAERDWRRLIRRRDVDAVVIATPDHWHAAMAIAAMEAGKDVYCEAPMALTLEQAAAFRACAERTRRVVQIGAADVSDARWRAAAEVVRSGELGCVRWAQAAVIPATDEPGSAAVVAEATPANLDWAGFLGEATARPFEPARFFRWRNYWDYSGGIATSLYFAQMAPLLLALGEAYPSRVSAAGGVYAADGRETPDSFVMNAEYASGHSIVLSHSAAGGRARPAVIRGELASMEVGDGFVRVIPETGAGAGRTIAVEPAESHMANWLRCIRSRQKCMCDEELGYRTMVAVAMALEAYKVAKTLRYDTASNTISEAPRRLTA